MLKRLHISLILFLGLLSQLYGQFDPATKAIQYYQEDKLDTAKMLIDSAIGIPSLRNKAQTWHFRGFIYRDIYEKKHGKERGSPARDTSIRAFHMSTQLDSAGKYTSTNEQAIKSLAITYYNDAVKTMDTSNYELSRKMYERYKEVHRLVEPDKDFTKRDIEYYESLGSVLMMTLETSQEKRPEVFREALTVYDRLIKIDPDNLLGNANRGKLFYNKGVRIVKNMDPNELDVAMLKKKQKAFRELLRKALPSLKKCHELKPDKMDCIEGLMGIYYGLNEDEKYQEFKKKKEKYKNEDGDPGNDGDR